MRRNEDIDERRNPGIERRMKKDFLEREETEEERLSRARTKLEEKAKLYEKCVRGTLSIEESLVNFVDRKKLDAATIDKEAPRTVLPRRTRTRPPDSNSSSSTIATETNIRTPWASAEIRSRSSKDVLEEVREEIRREKARTRDERAKARANAVLDSLGM